MARLFLVIALLAALQQAHAAPAFPPGMRIGLEPVGDLKPSPSGNGFADPGRNVSVVVAEMPAAAFEGLQRAMFGDPPAGATQVTREFFAFQDGVGYLHSAHVVENGVPTQRWVLLARQAVVDKPGELVVALINVSVPKPAGDVYSDAAVRQMLGSVTFRPPPIEEQLGLIPFRLENLAGFRVLQVQPEGVLLTEGPSDELADQPFMIVSLGRATAEQTADRQRFARDMLLAAPLRGLTIRSGEDMRIGGRAGHEIRAVSRDAQGNEVSVVQWIKFLGGAYLRILAASRSDRWDQTFNRFRAVRDGVDLR